MLNKFKEVFVLKNLEDSLVISSQNQGVNILQTNKYNFIILGVIFGLIGIFNSSLSITLNSGMELDTNSILLSLVGLFFEPTTILISTIMIFIYKLLLGGNFQVFSLLIILTSPIIGYAWKRFNKISYFNDSWINYLLLGFVVHVFVVLYMIFLPENIRTLTFVSNGFLIMVIFPFSTILFAISFNCCQNTSNFLKKILFKDMVSISTLDDLPLTLITANEDFLFLNVNHPFYELTAYDRHDVSQLTLADLFDEQLLDLKLIKKKIADDLDFTGDFVLTRKDLSKIWVSLKIVDNKNKNNKFDKYFTITIQDISAQKKVETLNNYLTYHDNLTGAFNFKYLQELESAWMLTKDYPKFLVSVDVSNLRIVNEVYGFKKGDELLIEVYQHLKNFIDNTDSIIRFKSSEFLIFINDLQNETLESFVYELQKSFEYKKINEINFAISMGYCVIETSDNIPAKIISAEDVMDKYKLLYFDKNLKNTVDILMKSLYAKNSREMYHSKRVSSLSKKLAVSIGLDHHNIEKVSTAGLMHDIGKIGVPDAILDKESQLTDSEKKTIREHTVTGYRILNSTIEFSDISEAILSHHERWDGLGYPRGISGENIPLIARIISIADSYDAMISDRPYRKRYSITAALNEIQANAGTQFDPQLADVFIRLMTKHNNA